MASRAPVNEDPRENQAHAGRIRIVVATTIRMGLIAAVLACIAGARTVHAQSPPPPSWGDVGVHWSPIYALLFDIDGDYGAPPGVWVTWGTGKFRLQVDYQRSRRQWFRPFGRRIIENHQGQEVPVHRDLQATRVLHVGEASLYWRVLEHSRLSPHLLFGFQYSTPGDRRCLASGEPAPRVRGGDRVPGEYQVAFAPGEEQRCGDDPLTRRHFAWVVAGGGIDIALSSRVFARVQAQLIQFRIGVGVRF